MIGMDDALLVVHDALYRLELISGDLSAKKFKLLAQCVHLEHGEHDAVAGTYTRAALAEVGVALVECHEEEAVFAALSALHLTRGDRGPEIVRLVAQCDHHTHGEPDAVFGARFRADMLLAIVDGAVTPAGDKGN